MGSDVEMASSSDPDDLYEEIEKMKALLLEDSRNYKNNNEMLQLLHRNGDFEELIEARDKIVQKVPLTSANWLIWIAEKRENSGNYEEIEDVFEKALKDSNDVAIWLERIYFSFSYGVAKTRQTFEKALAAHGTRFDSGGQIWLAYLSFETANAQGNPTDENMQYLENLYKRALRVATKHLQEIYEEACDIICGAKENGEIKTIFEETMKLARKLEKFEEHLEGAEGYQKYLQFEIESGDPGRIQMFHERIVNEFCEDENAWSSYGIWCEKKLKMPQISAGIYERALRFCPYSCILHQEALLAYERAAKTHEEIDAVFEYAKENVINSAEDGRALYRTYIYLRRRRVCSAERICPEDFAKIAGIFEEGAARLREWFPHDWDLKADFRAAQAFFYARFLKNVEKARPIWSDILASGFGKNAQKYIDAANFERQFGDAEHVRKYLNTALNSVSDDVNAIYQYYIQFEREEGTLEQLDAVLEKINSQVAHRAKRPQKTVPEPKIPAKLAQKRPFKSDNPPKPAENAEKPSFSSEDCSDEEKNRTIFVSNLDFGTTEEDLKKVIKGIVKVRFAKRIKGDLHRGFGYIVLENLESVREALKKDRVLVNGRPMFVSKNDPEHRVGFKYSKGLEKAKLFVKNVHFKADEKELEKIFSEFGKVENVRIVRHKNGQPKGCAYIDYETEEAATKALMATKIEMRNRELSVALSNPPTKSADKNSSKPSTSANSAPSSSSNSAQFLAPDQSSTRKSSMLQFLPRSTTKPAAPAPAPAEKPAENQDSSEIPAKKLHKPMSNDQFRQFLMKKS
ncbi:unnamed protein product [Caenorhabditis angaria]|uniref:RRM domain-containing protein n=1 Tax=Caenorhabditis angaria TaxID=860376 RepID=A0A9P1ILR9_9PELO|nr:unnamed protein product [Caenorhabditis angaria]